MLALPTNDFLHTSTSLLLSTLYNDLHKVKHALLFGSKYLFVCLCLHISYLVSLFLFFIKNDIKNSKLNIQCRLFYVEFVTQLVRSSG